jgi:hypothetical protein
MVNIKLHDIINLTVYGDNPQYLSPFTYRGIQTKGKILVLYGGEDSDSNPPPRCNTRPIYTYIHIHIHTYFYLSTDMFLSSAESGTRHNSVARKEVKFTPVVTIACQIKIRHELCY